MRQGQKILTAVLWGLTVLAMMSVIGAGLWRHQHNSETAGSEAFVQSDPEPGPLSVLATVPPFSLVDQDGKPLTNETLKGHVYVADLVFTRCAGPCPVMSGKMAALQKSIADPRVHFLTISVDPEHDTPPVLKAYAKGYGADESRWHFATGSQDAVFALAKGLLLPASPAQKASPIIHSVLFILVDQTGQIRGNYSSQDGDQQTRLIADASRLAAESGPATK
jgi:cytochrome oxidase Cu insertion factor (SCO1/SenC/PrrC family)